MTQQDDPGEPGEEAAQTVDSTPPARDFSAASSAPWFGYIGLGIALAAMVLGLVAMVVALLYFVRGGWG